MNIKRKCVWIPVIGVLFELCGEPAYDFDRPVRFFLSSAYQGVCAVWLATHYLQ